METPAKFTFSPDGNTNVFQIPVSMKGDNYVRIDINNTTLNDRTKFDLVNNAVVFVSKADVPAGSKLDIFVVQTDEGIANLGAVNSIDIVATNITTVNSVATSIASVNTTAANIAAVNNVSNNMTAVTNAVASASSASSSASSASASAAAASASATAAAASATAAAASLDEIDANYLGAKAADPTVDNDGNPLKVGAQYFNSTNNELLIWTGSAWQGAGTIGGTVPSLGVSGNLTIGDKIVHSGDTNTSIRFPAADTVTVETSGAERLRVTSAGNLTVNSNGSAAALDGISGIQVGNSAASTAGIALETSNRGYLWYIPSSSTSLSLWDSTANSDRLTIDASGNLGLGVTPSAWSSSAKAFQFGTYGSLYQNASGYPELAFNTFQNTSTNYIYRNTDVATRYSQTNGQHQWFNAPSGTAGNAITFTQAMTLDASGNLLVGTTTLKGRFTVTATGSTTIDCARTETTLSNQIVLRNGNGAVGSITTNGSSTAYNTSSDYRLKENVAPMQNALDTVARLNPVTYTWKADGSAGQGFIAHELQAVVPDCVTGEKDAVDAEGNPQYQGVDTSFLVATLVKAIQEQQAIIAALEARITALEA